MNKIYSPLKQIDSSGSSILKYQINSPIKTNYVEKKEKNIEFDYGLFNKYKLDDLINLQGDGFNEPKVIRMAFVENSALHLEESCIEIFEKYAKNEIACAGIYGKPKSGKSLLLDKLVNLSEVEGGHFTRNIQRSKGIYLWSIPFSRNNLKIFLMDINGYDQTEIDEDYIMLLNFYLFVCSAFIILQSPKEDGYQQFNSLAKQIKKCKKYFVSNEEISNDYFPNRLYCLFRKHVPQNKTIQPLKKLFSEFNFSIIGDAISDTYRNDFKDEDLIEVSMKRYNLNKKMLNQTYLKQISALFRDIHTKIQCKNILRLKFTGTNLVKLAVNTVQNINLKGHIHIDKIFHRSLKQLYTQAYDYHTQMYNEHLGKYLMDEKPIEIDRLLGIFQESHDLVFRSFDVLTIDPELKRVYGDKLEKYIRQKEKIIIAINKKKCNNTAKQAIPHINQKPQIKQMAQFIQKAKKTPRYMQQAYLKQIAPQIAKGIKQLEIKRKMQEENDKEKILKKKIEQQIKAKQNELVQIQKNYSKKVSVVKQTEKKRQFLEIKEKQLSDALKKIKMQTIQLVENNLKNSPRSPVKTIQQLRQQEMRLQTQSKMRQKAIKQLKSQPDLNTQKVQLLSSQIDQKLIKQKQLQSALASHIPRLQSVQAFRSSSKLSPRKVQSRAFQKNDNPNIRVITSTKL